MSSGQQLGCGRLWETLTAAGEVHGSRDGVETVDTHGDEHVGGGEQHHALRGRTGKVRVLSTFVRVAPLHWEERRA